MRNKWANVESLEQRRLLSVSFSNADLSGTWNLNTMGASGTVNLDGAGHITGGSVSDDSGDTNTPSGSYSITSNGGVTVNAGGVDTGAMNASKNFVAVGDGQQNNLGVLSTSGSGSFSTSSLSGTWYAYANGSKTASDGSTISGGDSGHAVFNFNGSGGFTASFVSDAGSPSQTLSGTYTVSSAGAVSINLLGPDNSSQIYAGSINSTGNALALNPPSLATAAADNAARLFVLVQPSGTYSKSSLDGNWTGVFDDGQASLNFNGDGKVSGSVVGQGAISGKYTVASNGTFNITLSPSAATDHKAIYFAGAIDSSHDIAAADQPTGGKNDDMLIMVSSEPVDHPPTLTKIATLKTATAGQPFSISYATLLAASNAADPDSDPISFQITTVGAGTLLFDGSLAIGGSIFSSDDTLTWTPPGQSQRHRHRVHRQSLRRHRRQQQSYCGEDCNRQGVSASKCRMMNAECRMKTKRLNQFCIHHSAFIIIRSIS